MNQTTKNGVNYHRVGDGDIVLLLHGVGLQWAVWQQQIDLLRKTHQVIAVDLPGHGGSSPLSEQARLPEFIAWLDQFVETLALPSVNLVGHSMGALIAKGFAIHHPEKVCRLALLNAVHKRSLAARLAVRQRAAEIQQSATDLTAPLKRWFDDDDDDDIKRQVKTWLLQMDRTAYATAYAAFAEGDLLYNEFWRQLNCPVLLLTADGDKNSTPLMAKQLAGEVAKGECCIIKKHHHMVNLTAPEQVNQALVQWLQTNINKN